MTYEIKIGDLGYSFVYDDDMGGWVFKTEADIFAEKAKKAMANPDCEQINIIIQSSGGSAIMAMDICNQILDLQTKTSVQTIINGFAASGACDIAFAAKITKAKRYSLVMTHKTWSYMGSGNADDFKETAENLEKFDNVRLGIYKEKNPKLSESDLNKLFKRTDSYFTPAELLELGLIQEIL